MPHLALDPQQLVDIDFDRFEFPKVRLIAVKDSKGALVSVSAGSIKLLNQKVTVSAKTFIAEVRALVEAFNADPISGWRELVIRTKDDEKATIRAEQDALTSRLRALRCAYDDAGFALLRARRASRATS